MFHKFLTLRVLSKIIYTLGSMLFLYVASLELYGAFIFLVQQSISIGRISLGTTAEALLQNYNYLKYAFKICLTLFLLFVLLFLTYFSVSGTQAYFALPTTIAIALFTWVRIYGARVIVCSSIVKSDGHSGLYEVFVSFGALLVFVIILYNQHWALFLICAILFVSVLLIASDYSKSVVEYEDFKEFIRNAVYLNYGGFTIAGLRIFDRTIVVSYFGLEGFGLFVIGQFLANICTYMFKISLDYLFSIKKKLISAPKIWIVMPLLIFGIICVTVASALDFLGVDHVNPVLTLLNKPQVENDGIELLRTGLLLGLGMFGVQVISTIWRLWDNLIITPIINSVLLGLSFALYGLDFLDGELALAKLKYQYVFVFLLAFGLFSYKQFSNSVK